MPLSKVVSNSLSLTTLAASGATTLSSTLGVTGVTTVQAGTAALPAITTTGDTNTGIFFPAADTIAFSEGGAEAMRINSSGRLGIGTTIPEGTLVVSNGGAAGLEFYTNYPGGGTGTYIQSFNRSGGAYVDTAYEAATHSFRTSGSERMRIDTSGNVGIGTNSPNSTLNVVGPQTTFDTNVFGQLLVRSTAAYNATPRAGIAFSVKYNSAGGFISGGSSIQGYKQTAADGEFANGLLFTTQAEGLTPSERMRIDSSGNLLVGTTSVPSTGAGTNSTIVSNKDYSAAFAQIINSSSTSGTQSFIQFGRGSSECGKITSTGTNSTTYATSSDYRLKHDIVPMTGALAKIAALKPVTYKWKSDNSGSEGFIAHQLAEVVPDAVVGEKDALNEDGSIKPQGIDTSFLVATLTAALQEAHGLIKNLEQRVAALEAV